MKRRSALVTGLVVIGVASIGSPATPQRVSARVMATNVPFAVLSSQASSNPSVSGNGQFVVYTAAPGVEDGRTSSVWITDREKGAQAELTLPKDGVRLGNSVNPVISADGCVVVATTEMGYDLFRDDDRGSRWDVYREVMPWCGGKSNDWAIVSTLISTEGLAQARGDVDPTQQAAVSAAGSVVAYVRPFESLAGFDESAHRPGSIDVVDMSIPIDDALHSTKAPGLPTDVAGGAVIHVGQRDPALSGDGTTVVFASDATSDQAVPDWVPPTEGTNTAVSQIFAWNRDDQDPFTAVTMLSDGPGGAGNASAVAPAVSADARFVAFSSSASNLDPAVDLSSCATACPAQVYVVDRDTDHASDATITFDEPGATKLSIVSAVDDPVVGASKRIAGNGASFLPSVSSDGQTIVFATQASNLMKVQTPGGGGATDGDLLIADLDTGRLRRAFDSPAPAPGAHSHPHLSANGRVLVADSLVAKQLGPLPLYADPSFVGRQVVAAAFQPKLSIAALDIGTIMVGVPGPEWYVNVVNEGPGSFVPAKVETDKPTIFAVSGGSCLEFAPVRAGESCSVSIIFTPDVPAPLAATLTVAEAGFEGVTLTSMVRGAGGEPALGSDQKGQDFGPTLVGATSPDTALFNISNISFTPAVITSVKFSGSNPKDFKILTNGCRSEVAIGGSCPVEVSFSPTASGRRTATLNVGTALGQYTSMFLSGDGFYSPTLVASPTVRPGDDIGVGGTGFPANTGVVIGWSDGSGAQLLVATDSHGGFMTPLPVRVGTRAGVHTLIAQVVNGPELASVPVEIERVAKRGAGAPTFPKR